MNRAAKLLLGGVPRYVRIYDNGGETFDRYTVCFTGKAGALRSPGCATEYQYLAMSENPCHPQGFGQWGGTKGQPADTMRDKPGWHWPPAMGRKCHLGKRIAFADLPEACQRLVLRDYAEIWKLV